jgi:hypothetical protein
VLGSGLVVLGLEVGLAGVVPALGSAVVVMPNAGLETAPADCGLIVLGLLEAGFCSGLLGSFVLGVVVGTLLPGAVVFPGSTLPVFGTLESGAVTANGSVWVHLTRCGFLIKNRATTRDRPYQTWFFRRDWPRACPPLTALTTHFKILPHHLRCTRSVSNGYFILKILDKIHSIIRNAFELPFPKGLF